MQQDANNSRAWLALGRLRENSGDLAQALQNYQRSLAINGGQPMVSERVAALSRQMTSQTDAALSTGGTRMASHCHTAMQHQGDTNSPAWSVRQRNSQQLIRANSEDHKSVSLCLSARMPTALSEAIHLLLNRMLFDIMTGSEVIDIHLRRAVGL